MSSTAQNAGTHQTAQQKRGILLTVVSIVALIATVLMLFLHKMLSPRILSINELRANGAIVFEKPRIIKPFSLVDHQGKSFNLDSLKGKWTYIFFGFTHCPDICPNTLAKLAQAYEQLDLEQQQEIQVALLSVDPARDTPEKLGEYVPFFHQDFIGVSGEFLQIMKISQNVNAAFSKVTVDDSYTIDHTGNVVIVNPQGHYHGFLKPPLELAAIKAAMYSIPYHGPQ